MSSSTRDEFDDQLRICFHYKEQHGQLRAKLLRFEVEERARVVTTFYRSPGALQQPPHQYSKRALGIMARARERALRDQAAAQSAGEVQR